MLLTPAVLPSLLLAVLEAFHVLAHAKVLFSIPPLYNATQLYGKVIYFYCDAATVIISGIVLALQRCFPLGNAPLVFIAAVAGHAVLHAAYVHFWPKVGIRESLHNLIESPEQDTASRQEEQLQQEAGLHVRRVVDWSAAPSWSEKKQTPWHVTNTLGTSFDMAVHIMMVWGHVAVLGRML